MRRLLFFALAVSMGCGDVDIESEPDAGAPDPDFVNTRLASLPLSRGDLSPFAPDHNEYEVTLGLDAI